MPRGAVYSVQNHGNFGSSLSVASFTRLGAMMSVSGVARTGSASPVKARGAAGFRKEIVTLTELLGRFHGVFITLLGGEGRFWSCRVAY